MSHHPPPRDQWECRSKDPSTLVAKYTNPGLHAHSPSASPSEPESTFPARYPNVATDGSSTAPTAPCGALAVLHDVLGLDVGLSTLIALKPFLQARAVASCGFDSRTGSR